MCLTVSVFCQCIIVLSDGLQEHGTFSELQTALVLYECLKAIATCHVSCKCHYVASMHHQQAHGAFVLLGDCTYKLCFCDAQECATCHVQANTCSVNTC